MCLKRGEVYENPVTGERAVVRVGAAETKGARLEVDPLTHAVDLLRNGAVLAVIIHRPCRGRSSAAATASPCSWYKI